SCETSSEHGLQGVTWLNFGGLGLAGACLKKTRNPTTVKPQLTFNRLAHRNPDTPVYAATIRRKAEQLRHVIELLDFPTKQIPACYHDS
ncbi:hypothetical protein PY257_16385, partial [Ramlibacter sp. H39-3-26]|uniref:hypothetical protein n=1 Tax=Curvibacter soli TaxID=3031331 RepID=UPI0023DB3384